jgi:hypothetical protein
MSRAARVLLLNDHPLTADLIPLVVARLDDSLHRVWIGDTNPGQSAAPTSYQKPRVAWQQELRDACSAAGKRLTICWGHRVDVLGPPKAADLVPLDHTDWLLRSPVPGWRERWLQAGWSWSNATWGHPKWWSQVDLARDAVLYTTSADPKTKHITFSGVCADMQRPLYQGWAIRQANLLARVLGADALIIGRKGWMHYAGRLLTPEEPTLSGIVAPVPYTKMQLEGLYDRLISGVARFVPVVTLTYPRGSVRWGPTMEAADSVPEAELVVL